MYGKTPSFEIELSNIPHVNLRQQFKLYHGLFNSEKFLAGWTHWRGGDAIETPFFRWYGFPHEFYTLVIQQSVLGIESYLPGAVTHEAAMSGKLTQDLAKMISNPFLLKGRGGTARRYYIILPAVLSETLCLDKCSPELWGRVKQFYDEIRNPLFHGRQVSSDNPAPISHALNLIADVYAWIDSWHDQDAFWKAFVRQQNAREQSQATKQPRNV